MVLWLWIVAAQGSPKVTHITADSLPAPFATPSAYKPGDVKLRQGGQKLMSLPGGGYNQHWTRNVAFSPRGDKMFVTVGSATNASPESPPRATIIEANPDGSGRSTFASGLRNPVGL